MVTNDDMNDFMEEMNDPEQGDPVPPMPPLAFILFIALTLVVGYCSGESGLVDTSIGAVVEGGGCRG